MEEVYYLIAASLDMQLYSEVIAVGRAKQKTFHFQYTWLPTEVHGSTFVYSRVDQQVIYSLGFRILF